MFRSGSPKSILERRDVLKLPSVGTRDNFFDLGSHSLLAVQMHRRLREKLAQAIPLNWGPAVGQLREATVAKA